MKRKKTIKEQLQEILNSIDFDNNKLIKINDNLYLTKNQINTLERYDINYQISNSMRDLMIKIEEILDYEEIEELEILLENLTERQYYENTNK